MPAISLAEMLREEVFAIDGTVLPAPDPADPQKFYRDLNARNHAALCLSGGGIRSAAFALGVIQRLAAEKLAAKGPPCALAGFHYLSTVSGGGYIGCWLSAWLMRARIALVKDDLGGGTGEVLDRLADMTSAAEAPAIENLRVNSNYLTPKVGALSADLWADIATYCRNLLLNWLVIAPLIVAVVIAVKLMQWGQYVALTATDHPADLRDAAIGAALLMLVPLSFEVANRPTVRLMNAGQPSFLAVDLGMTLLAALILATSLYGGQVADTFRWIADDAGLEGGALYAAGWFAARLWHWLAPPAPDPDFPTESLFRREALAWVVAGAVFGMTCALFPRIVLALGWSGSPAACVVLGVPWILAARIVGSITFAGLSSFRTRSNEDREWSARAAGWGIAALVSWLVASALILFASDLTHALGGYAKAWLATIGGVSGLVTVLVGKSKATAALIGGLSDGPSSKWTGLALGIATPIFACCLLIAVSAIVDQVFLGAAFTHTPLFDGSRPAAVSASHLAGSLMTGAACALLLLLVAGLCIDVNQFSMHALYRDRLVRCFLAASRHNRPDRNRFTDLAPKDNPRLHELGQAIRPDEPWRPLHIINVALNIVSTRNLAWQERKAESFTISPLHCGSACLPGEGANAARGAYRPADKYGKGIRLGTAMAISGASVSPNMGYQSSPAVTFFMAIFNVRLGWWLGNPARGTFARKGPGFATWPLLAESFGLTTDDRPYVYLSDGGHFENLGLYEMVRRRCRWIVVSDADCDPDFLFEDLGNAVRKIWLDLRVKITFAGLDLLRKRGAVSAAAPDDVPYHAVGTIHYEKADGAGARDGLILYLKPSLHGDEPVDVLSYAAGHPTFPHESTNDQWFTESQFESYRALGFTEMDAALKAAHGKARETPGSIGDILGSL